MKRRTFLQTVGAGAVLPFMLQGFRVRAFSGQPEFYNALADVACEDRVLVLIQLVGGNDGLNTVIPIDQYAQYYAARPTLAVDEKSILKITDSVGLHPNLSGINNLYKEGKVCIVQNVGYPSPDFSHFRSTDIWLTASDSDKVITSGWLGRWLDTQYPGFPKGYPKGSVTHPVAIQIGNIVSTSLASETANTGIAFNEPNNYSNIVNFGNSSATNTQFQYQVSFIRETGLQIQNFAKPVMDAANKTQNKSTLYPTKGNNLLADQLRIVAQLIAGGLKTRIYIVTQPGYDTHASQNTIRQGNPHTHPNLLLQLSEAVTAFQDDIQLLGIADKVTGITISEFGRRIQENANLGTDHGAAAPLFVFGTNVTGGIIGSNPVIPATVTLRDNVAMTYDFRSVYASLLHDWLCVPQQDIQNVLYKNFPLLPIIKGSTASSVNDTDTKQQTSVSCTCTPNPVSNNCQITIVSDETPTKLSLYNNIGKEIEVVLENTLPKGNHIIQYATQHLQSGNYYWRIQTARTQHVIPMVVLR